MIEITSDVSGAAPHITPQPALDLRQVGNVFVKGLQLGGQYVYSPGPGGFPCRVAGLGISTASHVEDYSCAAFSSGIVYGGLVSGNETAYGYDHSTLRNLHMDGVGFGILLAPNAGGAGDQVRERIEVGAYIAPIAIGKSASSGFVGSSIERFGWNAPVGTRT